MQLDTIEQLDQQKHNNLLKQVEETILCDVGVNLHTKWGET